MDITQLILDDHAEQRRLFSIIEQIDPKDVDALSAVWLRLSAFLDVHAEAEERFFYPQLMKIGEGANDAEDGTVAGETEDAIEDHNKLRDAVKAVEKHKVGTKAWFDAVGEANVVNSKHMGEEERGADLACEALQIAVGPGWQHIPEAARLGTVTIPGKAEAIAVGRRLGAGCAMGLLDQGVSGRGDELFQEDRNSAIGCPATHIAPHRRLVPPQFHVNA